MSYCNIEDVKNIVPEPELINLTNDEITQDSKINTDVLNLVIQHADDLINGFLRTRYKLPLSFTPPIVQTLSADISAYRVYIRRPSDVPEHIVKNYEKALSLLDKIQSGKILLDLPSEHPDEEIQRPALAFRTNKTEKDRIFNDNFLRSFRHTL